MPGVFEDVDRLRGALAIVVVSTLAIAVVSTLVIAHGVVLWVCPAKIPFKSLPTGGISKPAHARQPVCTCTQSRLRRLGTPGVVVKTLEHLELLHAMEPGER